MKITVAVPTYNREKTIERCINSVLSQSLDDSFDFDVLVVDNNSSDNSKNILHTYESNNKVNIIYNDINVGMAGNWNKCFINAKGDFVYLLHSDDIMLPGTLINVSAFLSKYPETDFLFGKVYVEREGVIRKDISFLNEDHEGILDNNWLLDKFFYKGIHVCPPQTWVVRRGIIESCGGYINNNICCDFNMSFKVVCSGYKIGFVNASFAQYVIHESNEAGGDIKKHGNALIEAIENLYQVNGRFNIDKEKLSEAILEVKKNIAFGFLKVNAKAEAIQVIKEINNKMSITILRRDIFLILFKTFNINLVKLILTFKKNVKQKI